MNGWLFAYLLLHTVGLSYQLAKHAAPQGWQTVLSMLVVGLIPPYLLYMGGAFS